jgi:hypothetical protein
VDREVVCISGGDGKRDWAAEGLMKVSLLGSVLRIGCGIKMNLHIALRAKSVSTRSC